MSYLWVVEFEVACWNSENDPKNTLLMRYSEFTLRVEKIQKADDSSKHCGVEWFCNDDATDRYPHEPHPEFETNVCLGIRSKIYRSSFLSENRYEN